MQFRQELRQESRIVGGICVLMVALAFVILLLRWLFGIGLVWLQEAVLWLHAALFLTGALLASCDNSHVRIDLFDSAKRRRRRIDRIGHWLFLIPMMLVLAIGAIGPVGRSWQQLERSAEAGGLQGLFLLKSLLPLAAFGFLVWAMVDFRKSEDRP